jgi:chaperonin GroES
MNITPLYDRILVKRLEEEDKTKGGLIIPDTAKEKPVKGQVVAAGSGRRVKDGSIRPLDVKKGDKILFEKWAGSEVKLEGIDHLILREDEVLGILD